MKRYCWGVKLSREDGGQKMLAGVLLNVIQAAGPIDFSLYVDARLNRLARKVPDGSLFVFLYRLNRRLQLGSAGRSRRKQAGVAGLASAGGIKGGAIERDLPGRDPVGAGRLTDVGY